VPVKAGYLFLTGGGLIFLWSGVRGKSVTGVIRAVIGGENPASAANANLVSGDTSVTGTGTNTTGIPNVSGGGNATANQSLARVLAVAMGHPAWIVGQQWQDWLSLWSRESGWSQTADNPSSGAYGIPQALPPTKLPLAGQQAGGSNPTAQIGWGILYISGRYGSPSEALVHENQFGWY
jgi:resuscitation-promoting factor RpfB